MRLVVAFDINADIIDVPQSVINNKDALRKKFLKWLYNKKTNTIIGGYSQIQKENNFGHYNIEPMLLLNG